MRVLGITAFLAASLAEAANPIRRVVTLLQDMQTELTNEGEKEEELYKKFMCYCNGNTDKLSKAGEDAAAAIEEFTAKAKAASAEQAQVKEELKQHKLDRADAKEDLKKATSLRNKEHDQFVKDAGETKDNIDSIKSAVAALEKGMGASAFLQTPIAGQLRRVTTVAEFLDASDREALSSFLETGSNKDYAPQSNQIVGILKNMNDEMKKSLGGIVEAEDAAAAAFADLKKAKTKEIEAASGAIEAKTARSGQLAVSIVQNQNAAEDATKSLDDNQKFLATLKVACKEKTADWETRSKMRQDEIVAISEAIGILNDDDALDVFKSAVPNKGKAAGPVFLQRVRTSKGDVSLRARNILRKIKNTSSPILNLLAHTASSRLSESKVDFSVVLKMIDEMVALLKKEGKDDEKHRDFCNGEFDASDDEKKATEQKLATIASAIDEMKDQIEQLKNEIANHNAEIADSDKAVAEATEQRKSEHAEYTEKVQLNEAAIQLLFKAENRLNKFYNPNLHVASKQRELTDEDRAVLAAGGQVDRSLPGQVIKGTTQTVFIQRHMQQTLSSQPEPPPETYGAYEKKSGKSTGVVALLKNLTRELESEVQEAEHNEKTSQKDYEELSAESAESRAQNVKAISHKEKSKAEVEGRLQEAKANHALNSEQLAQVKAYIADLHASCDFIVAQFELRREARSNELDGLKSAKAVLSGADYA